jgi:hypothetical protein
MPAFSGEWEEAAGRVEVGGEFRIPAHNAQQTTVFNKTQKNVLVAL